MLLWFGQRQKHSTGLDRSLVFYQVPEMKPPAQSLPVQVLLHSKTANSCLPSTMMRLFVLLTVTTQSLGSGDIDLLLAEPNSHLRELAANSKIAV